MKVQKIGTCVETCEGALGSLEGKGLGEFGRVRERGSVWFLFLDQ